MTLVAENPKVDSFGENFPKVSSPNRRSSRFQETLGGDKFRSRCAVGGRRVCPVTSRLAVHFGTTSAGRAIGPLQTRSMA